MTSISTTKQISRLHDDKPAFIYGTAWKKDQTKRLVKEALAVGFWRVDTAAQPRHYQEALVGEALREAFTEGILKREELYLQTKYTTPAGQDLNNIPYDPNAPLDSQIHTSVASSLKNLRHISESPDDSYLDCMLLHSPLPTTEQTIQAWKLLETYVPHRIRSLGISNVTLSVLEALYQNATVKPTVVQNRFYPQTRYDVPLRNFCKEHDIVYQSFWTLTGNPALLQSQPVAALARAAQVEIPVALYALVIDQGVVVLNGSTSREHMEMDLEGIQKVRDWAVEKPQEFAAIAGDFKAIVE
ncbi:hypothetical protein COCCADRAFT_8345 [Bipolaris zeicola 26-R-13]|uniref:NADP-dependent oxidoreductase domain-containing protein n=1 Tax=Cochliobolus carbonum (strain 26-R-13) TaxID=930089 RepID=W6XPX6_COCC2|nr:uncharacterized protein COCCADRAFT_8345 [Bipolaris zeicola 26-R-13]EUC29422.1 hypothetical protein COCCADRAFT_8345 [Bipolaris zeicola 26-R-13]